MSTIKFKKLHPEATVPRRQREGDAGFDIYSTESLNIYVGGQAVINTGIACAILIFLAPPA